MSAIEHTAYHETGHAIASDELGVQYGRISIVPGEGKLGSVTVEGDGFFNPGSDPFSPESEKLFREWAEQQAVIDYAGHAAVVELLGIGDMSGESAEAEGAGCDFEKASDRLGGDPQRIEHAKTRALEIVRARADDVRKIADVLVERQRLDPQEVDCVIYHGDPGYFRKWSKLWRANASSKRYMPRFAP